MISNILRAEIIRGNNSNNSNINSRNGTNRQSSQDFNENVVVENIIRNIINRNNNNNTNNNKDKKIEELLEGFVLTEQIISKLENKQCLICLDDYLVGEKICYLPCFHLFHYLCIKSWVGRSNKCPLCKNIIKFEK